MKTYFAPILSVEVVMPDTAISSGAIGEPCVGCDAAASGKEPGGMTCAPDAGWVPGDKYVVGNYYYSCTMICE